MPAICPFAHLENKNSLYHGKDCMKKFCKSLRKQAKNINNFEKKLLPFTKVILKSHQDPKVCYICRKRILRKLSKSIKYGKVRNHCHYAGKYRGTAHSTCNLKFNLPNEIPIILHNGPNYDYHFFIK